MGLVYEEQTRHLRRCFFDVQNEVGLGRQEHAYHRACEMWLAEHDIPFCSKKPHHLLIEDQIAHVLFPDLVVWDSITVELKAVPRDVNASELAQLFDYLKHRKDRLGLLVNMGLDRVAIQRLIYESPKYTIEEDWEYWTDAIQGSDREVGMVIRDSLRSIFETHGSGYSREITEKLVRFELTRRGLSLLHSPVCEAVYRGTTVDKSPLECVVVEGRIVFVLSVLFDTNNFNINRGKSFLEALSLPWGIAVNFGRTKLEVAGLRHRTL